MRNFLTIWSRELTAFFSSPAAYVTMVVSLVVTGFGFCLGASLSRGEPLRIDILLFWLPTLWLMVLIVATVTTMRLIAEERKSGTIETLMTAPVTEVEVVLGKYAAAMTLFAVTFAPTASYVMILRRFSSGVETVDTGSIAAGYLVFFLLGGFYVSIGVLMSALTRSQITAAMACFAVLCVVFVGIGALGNMTHGGVADFLRLMSVFDHVRDFSRGVIDTRTVVFYVSGTVLMLFVAVKAVESRRWI